MTTTSDESDHTVIYCNRTNRIVESVPRGIPSATVIELLQERYGDQLIALPFEDAWLRFENFLRSPPTETTAQRFDETLNVLPPVAWKTDSDGESFKISERLAGTITAIFVRIGTRYVTFHDDIRTPHSECCRRAAEYLSQHPATATE